MTEHEIRGDRPLPEDGVDLLGFEPLAGRAADAILSRSLSDGIVIGLEGKWGSGKSSLMNLTLRAMRNHPEKNPAIVQFRPWLVGSRDALLTALFGDVAKAIDEIHLRTGDVTGPSVSKAKDVAKKLRRFGKRLGNLAPAASLAGWLVPGAETAAKVLEAVGKAAKAEESEPTLAETKDELSKALAALPERIVVTVDDVDRLEPSEVREILRLVRSVADFENVIYVLCYDPSILAEAIQNSIGVADGHAYLEKIVQVTVAVPKPETFQLRRMFQEGLASIVPEIDEETASRIASVIGTEGALWLTTPRMVVRTLDSLRFALPTLAEQVDLADLVWLHLIKVGDSNLYRWIEDYLATMAALSSGRVAVNDQAAKADLTRLNSILEKNGRNFEEVRWSWSQVLPGFSVNMIDEKKAQIYRRVDDADRLRALAGRRLASPDHYRLYFALALPKGAPSESDFLRLWKAADTSQQEVSALFLEWFSTRGGGLTNKGEMILDRLKSVPPNVLNKRRSRAILLALANVLDEPQVREALDEWGVPGAWPEAERLLPVLRERLGATADPVTTEAFRDGKALGWLNSVFRSEVFNHGLYGDRAKPEALRLLPVPTFADIVSIMQRRYEHLSLKGFLSHLRPASLLFGWHQSGGGDKPRELIRRGTNTDQGLVRVLEGLSGIIHSSSKGAEMILKRENVEPFLDYDTVRQRISMLAKSRGKLAAQAKIIEQRFEEGESF